MSRYASDVNGLVLNALNELFAQSGCLVAASSRSLATASTAM
jgi:hypothetical protein